MIRRGSCTIPFVTAPIPPGKIVQEDYAWVAIQGKGPKLAKKTFEVKEVQHGDAVPDFQEGLRKLEIQKYTVAAKYFVESLAQMQGKQKWADVLALLPARLARAPLSKDARSRPNEGSSSSITPKPLQHRPLKGRATYGSPTNFRGLLHEPMNEQGVVLLFGMLAKDLGYMIEAVQTGFPDCEAMRQIAPERWQRVHIEFEFESRNFRDHGHPASGCDVIVCWRHNWDDCPEGIEVVELSSIIKSLAKSED